MDTAVNHWPRVERASRRELKRLMRVHEVTPARKRWAICVETTAIEIPVWALAKRDERFSVSEHHVWFRGRNSGRAKILERQDRQAGGSPEVTAVEYRVCSNCGRLLLSLEAEARRLMDERWRVGRQMPCGGECGITEAIPGGNTDGR